jgi:hypothetical protein
MICCYSSKLAKLTDRYDVHLRIVTVPLQSTKYRGTRFVLLLLVSHSTVRDVYESTRGVRTRRLSSPRWLVIAQ